MAIRKRDLEALPQVSGDDFSKLAAAFRDFVLACQDETVDVVETLIDLLGWDGDDAEWVAGVLEDGVGHLGEKSDPRAEQFKKQTTVVGRKKRG